MSGKNEWKQFDEARYYSPRAQTIYLEGDRQVEAADLYPLPAGPGAETGLQCCDGAILRGEGRGISKHFTKLETPDGDKCGDSRSIFETCPHNDKVAFYIRLQSEP